MKTKIVSYSQYATATAWDKLKFVATAKHNDKHIVKLSQVIFAENIRRNELQFIR